jgi:small conductance mechanosensitive channel
MTIICTGLLLVMPIVGVAQDTPPVAIPSPSPQISTPTDGIFFADIMVRGQTILQIGSLANLSASDRAKIINRQIASFLASEVDRVITSHSRRTADYFADYVAGDYD